MPVDEDTKFVYDLLERLENPSYTRAELLKKKEEAAGGAAAAAAEKNGASGEKAGNSASAASAASAPSSPNAAGSNSSEQKEKDLGAMTTEDIWRIEEEEAAADPFGVNPDDSHFVCVSCSS
jgi:hypothetical protein